MHLSAHTVYLSVILVCLSVISTECACGSVCPVCQPVCLSLSLQSIFHRIYVYVSLSVCGSVCLFNRLTVYQSACLPVAVSLYPLYARRSVSLLLIAMCPYGDMPVYLSVYSAICLYMYIFLSTCLFLCLSTYLSVCAPTVFVNVSV